MSSSRYLLALALAVAAATLLFLSPAPADAAKRCANAAALPGTISKASYERAIRCLTNRERRERGRRSLDDQRQLHKAAARHNRVMLERSCFDHQCRGEPDLVERITRAGYLPCNCSWSVGENIAWGEGSLGTPKKIVSAWMHSEGHRANILNRDFRDIGVAVSWGRPGARGAIAATVTQDFGVKR